MEITAQALESTLNAIHAKPHRLVYEFTGAGSQALTWLHSVGGSSRTVLEATDRYASSSLADLIGFVPQQSTSAAVAKAIATAAYDRARALAAVDNLDDIPVGGIGCTATIATDRIKRGNHRCCIALADALGVVTYQLTLTKGQRSREEEEALVSLVVMKVIADWCAVSTLPELLLQDTEQIQITFDPAKLLQQLTQGEINWVLINRQGQLTGGDTKGNIATLSGSFNPLHEGHRCLASVAAETLGQEVYFELPLVNADKAPIDLLEARRRAVQFSGIAPLLLTRAPLFTQKATIFPTSIFVLGVDTAERLMQIRFYNQRETEMKTAFNTIRGQGCRFLVAGRSEAGQFRTLEALHLPETCRDLFEAIPEAQFRADISSTELRSRP